MEGHGMFSGDWKTGIVGSEESCSISKLSQLYQTKNVHSLFTIL